MATPPRILTPTFAVLCMATICFFVSSNILIPVLPRYLVKSGLPPYQLGTVIGAWSVSAIAARLVIGREVDRRGRKLFLALGIGVGAAATLIYPLVSDLVPLLALRLVHGVSIASFYPAATALIADISPPARRGEALAYFSMLLYAGFAIGPAVGEALVPRFGFSGAFLGAAAIGGLGLGMVAFIQEPPRRRDARAHFPLFHRAALFPAVVLGLASTSFAAVGTFVPLYVSAEGDGNSRSFFLVLATTIILLRSFVGRIADRVSPAALVVPGTVFCAGALISISAGARPAPLLTGATLFGLGWGALFPGLLNFTMNRVGPDERGSAMGTFTAAFDAIFGASQPLLGLILDVSSFAWVFIAGALGALASALVFVAGRPRSDAAFPATETAG